MRTFWLAAHARRPLYVALLVSTECAEGELLALMPLDLVSVVLVPMSLFLRLTLAHACRACAASFKAAQLLGSYTRLPGLIVCACASRAYACLATDLAVSAGRF